MHLKYAGKQPLKLYIINTDRSIKLNPGDSIEVTKEEKEEILRSRVANYFKEGKKTKETEEDKGGDLDG